jgi:hypothetical protein
MEDSMESDGSSFPSDLPADEVRRDIVDYIEMFDNI